MSNYSNEHNSESLNNEDQKTNYFPIANNVVVHSYLSKEGKISFDEASLGNNFSMSTKTAKVHGNNIYFVGNKGYFINTAAIGVIEL